MNTSIQTIGHEEEKKILKEIISGKYRDYYLIYNRKSTDEPNSQKNSLHYQKSENLKCADRLQLQIASLVLPGFCRDGIVSEKHSGFKEDSQLSFGNDGTVKYRVERPKFYQLAQYLSKGYFKGVIILCWDRASRNKADDTIIDKLMKSGVDFRFTLTTYDKSSSGALHMDIDGMFAAHHSRVTSEKVRMTIKNSKESGIMPYKAGVGYLNLGSMENKPFDPERAPIVKQMFELAKEGWSYADIAGWSIEQGFTMPPLRRKKTKEEKLQEEEDDTTFEIKPICRLPNANTIYQILKNRVYIGEVLSPDGTFIKSKSHEPLISKELFYAVQDAFKRKKVSTRYTESIKCPLRGMIRCEECKRVYTPYMKKGIQYFSSRCVTNCENSNKSFNFKFIKEKIQEFIKGVVFTREQLDEIISRTVSNLPVLEIEHQKKIEAIARKRKKSSEELAYLKKDKSSLLQTGAYSPSEYMEAVEALSRDIYRLQTEEHNLRHSPVIIKEAMCTLSELIENLYLLYVNAKPEETEGITQSLFSELSISENTLKIQYKRGIDAVKNYFFVTSPLGTGLSEVATNLPDIEERIKELKKLIKKLNNIE
ncbi:MAG: recombinase family protein [Bacteroidia bacterium]